jgi:hypothetical protein
MLNATVTVIVRQTQLAPTVAMALAASTHMSNALAHAKGGSIRNALGGRSILMHWVTPHILFLGGTTPHVCPFRYQPAPRGVRIPLSGVSSAMEP